MGIFDLIPFAYGKPTASKTGQTTYVLQGGGYNKAYDGGKSAIPDAKTLTDLQSTLPKGSTVRYDPVSKTTTIYNPNAPKGYDTITYSGTPSDAKLDSDFYKAVKYSQEGKQFASYDILSTGQASPVQKTVEATMTKTAPAADEYRVTLPARFPSQNPFYKFIQDNTKTKINYSEAILFKGTGTTKEPFFLGASEKVGQQTEPVIRLASAVLPVPISPLRIGIEAFGDIPRFAVKFGEAIRMRGEEEIAFITNPRKYAANVFKNEGTMADLLYTKTPKTRSQKLFEFGREEVAPAIITYGAFEAGGRIIGFVGEPATRAKLKPSGSVYDSSALSFKDVIKRDVSGVTSKISLNLEPSSSVYSMSRRTFSEAVFGKPAPYVDFLPKQVNQEFTMLSKSAVIEFGSGSKGLQEGFSFIPKAERKAPFPFPQIQETAILQGQEEILAGKSPKYMLESTVPKKKIFETYVLQDIPQVKGKGGLLESFTNPAAGKGKSLRVKITDIEELPPEQIQGTSILKIQSQKGTEKFGIKILSSSRETYGSPMNLLEKSKGKNIGEILIDINKGKTRTLRGKSYLNTPSLESNVEKGGYTIKLTTEGYEFSKGKPFNIKPNVKRTTVELQPSGFDILLKKRTKSQESISGKRMINLPEDTSAASTLSIDGGTMTKQKFKFQIPKLAERENLGITSSSKSGGEAVKMIDLAKEKSKGISLSAMSILGASATFGDIGSSTTKSAGSSIIIPILEPASTGKEKPINIPKIGSTSRISDRNVIISFGGSSTRGKEKPIVVPLFDIASGSKTKIPSLQVTTQRQSQRTRQFIDYPQPTRSKASSFLGGGWDNGGGGEEPPEPKPEKPLKFFVFPDEATTQTRKTQTEGGWIPYAKQGGKFIRLSQKSMTMEAAMGLGGSVVDNTTSAQFKVKRTKKPPQDSGMAGFFNSAKFRKKGNSYIEKNTFRIDTEGEFQGITVKGWLAKKNKGVRIRI